MPITGLRFGADTYPPPREAADIHVLRGQSTDNLRDRLWVEQSAEAAWEPLSGYTGDDVEFLFVPVFKIEYDASEPEFRNFGIRVNKATGRVTVENDWNPNSSPRNFIVEAQVTDNGSGIPPVKIKNAIIRVHVHLSVEQIWLTPSLLSVRRAKPAGHEEKTSYQFTVRAQFDDGTVGDLTFAGGLTFSPAQWFSGSLVRIPPQAAASVTPFKVKVTASPKWNSRSAEARLEVLKPWAAEADVPAAVLLDGNPDVWSGALKPENVPNILFLGCGFQSEDEDTFWLVADTIVHKLKRDPLLQPFGYLATSMNYWRLMVPAPEAGVSVRCEVQQFTEGGRLFAKRVRAPVEPPPKATDWELQHLIYMAGLPVPADLNLVEDTAPPGGAPANADAVRDIPITRLNLQRLFDRWAATMRLDFPQEMINAIKKDVVKQWLAMADRTFIDEVNNFPAIMAGVPPAASFNDTALLAYHNLRGTIGDERVAFFRRVRAAPRNGISITLDDSNGQAPELGNLWAEQRPGFAFDNRPLIIALSNTPYGHANFREMGVQTCLSLTGRGADGTSFEMTIPVARATGRNALMLQLPRGDLSLRSPTWRVCAHELAHAFGLGDEYARIRQRRTGQESELNDYANLMFEAGARVDGETEKINFGLIKWNWHRIRKACVITLPIQQNLDGTFLVFVRKGSGLQFAVGDMVRLRQARERRSHQSRSRDQSGGVSS